MLVLNRIKYNADTNYDIYEKKSIIMIIILI